MAHSGSQFNSGNYNPSDSDEATDDLTSEDVRSPFVMSGSCRPPEEPNSLSNEMQAGQACFPTDPIAEESQEEEYVFSKRNVRSRRG
jgi:hypothetical protein